MAICSKCGKEIPEESKFCTMCGEVPGEVHQENQVSPEEEKKPGNAKKIGIIAVVIALIAVAGVLAMTVLKPKIDPKEAVIAAFKSVFQDEKVGQLEEIFGINEMRSAMLNENSEFGLTLTYNGGSIYNTGDFDGSSIYNMVDFSGSSIEIVSKNELDPVKSSARVGLKYKGMDFIHSEAYMDDTELMAAVPEMSGKVFTINFADDLEGQIEHSPFLGQYLQSTGFDRHLKQLLTSPDNRSEHKPFDLKALWERYETGTKAIDEFKAAMIVTKADTAVKTVDGKDETCKVYEVVIPGIAFVDFARSTSDFFLEDETLKSDVLKYIVSMVVIQKNMNPYGINQNDPQEYWNDVQLTGDQICDELEKILKDDADMLVYVDSKGRMAGLEFNTKLTYDEVEKLDMKLEVSLKGGEYLTQNANAVLTFYQEDEDVEVLTFTLNKAGSSDEKVLLSDVYLLITQPEKEYSVNYSGAYHAKDRDYEVKFAADMGKKKYSFAMEGEVLEYEKGKMIEVTADSLRAQVNEEYTELSGRFLYKPLEDEVTKPKGTQLDILAATEADFTNVVMEIYFNSMGMSSFFQ